MIFTFNINIIFINPIKPINYLFKFLYPNPINKIRNINFSNFRMVIRTSVNINSISILHRFSTILLKLFLIYKGNFMNTAFKQKLKQYNKKYIHVY